MAEQGMRDTTSWGEGGGVEETLFGTFRGGQEDISQI